MYTALLEGFIIIPKFETKKEEEKHLDPSATRIQWLLIMGFAQKFVHTQWENDNVESMRQPTKGKGVKKPGSWVNS